MEHSGSGCAGVLGELTATLPCYLHLTCFWELSKVGLRRAPAVPAAPSRHPQEHLCR